MTTRRSFLFGLAATPFAMPVLATAVAKENLVTSEAVDLVELIRQHVLKAYKDSEYAAGKMPTTMVATDPVIAKRLANPTFTYYEIIPLEESRKRRALMEEWANFAVFSEPKINLVRKMS